MRQRRAELGGQRERRCVERARAVPPAGSNGGDQPLEHHAQCGGLGGEHCKGHPLASRRACDTGRPPPTGRPTPTGHSPTLDMQRGRERLRRDTRAPTACDAAQTVRSASPTAACNWYGGNARIPVQVQRRVACLPAVCAAGAHDGAAHLGDVAAAAAAHDGATVSMRRLGGAASAAAAAATGGSVGARDGAGSIGARDGAGSGGARDGAACTR